MSTSVSDIYRNPSEFSDLLDEAECNASTEWEMQFVQDLVTSYDEYADAMYLSDRQIEILERIANGQNP